MVTRILIPLIAALAVSACQHNPGSVPAVLADDSAETLSALKAGLATALNRAHIELGAGDPTSVSRVSVLPPRPTNLETRSPAMPEMFDLFIHNGRCYAVRDGTETEITLPDVPCRAL